MNEREWLFVDEGGIRGNDVVGGSRDGFGPSA